MPPVPPVRDSIDTKRAIPHLVSPGAAESFDPKKVGRHLVILNLTWTVEDLQTGQSLTFAADGGHFRSVQGHTYKIQVHASDKYGLAKITLDGTGQFGSASYPDRNGQYWQAPGLLPASVPHQQFNALLPPAPIAEQLTVEMADHGPFDYFALSCGTHHFNGMSEPAEFFAVTGVMVFSAFALNTRDDIMTATLRTFP